MFTCFGIFALLPIKLHYLMMDMVTFFHYFFRGGGIVEGEGDEVIVVFTFIAIKFLVYIRNYHFTYCVF